MFFLKQCCELNDTCVHLSAEVVKITGVPWLLCLWQRARNVSLSGHFVSYLLKQQLPAGFWVALQSCKKAIISFVMSVCLSFCPSISIAQHGSRCKGFP